MTFSHSLFRLITTPLVLYLRLLTFTISWEDIPRTYSSWIVLFLFSFFFAVCRYSILDHILTPFPVFIILTGSLFFSLLVFDRGGFLQILSMGAVDFAVVALSLLFSRLGFNSLDHLISIYFLYIFCFLRLYRLFLCHRILGAKKVDIFL